MRLASLGPVRALVEKLSTLMEPEALDLDEVLRLPLEIIGVHLAVG